MNILSKFRLSIDDVESTRNRVDSDSWFTAWYNINNVLRYNDVYGATFSFINRHIDDYTK